MNSNMTSATRAQNSKSDNLLKRTSHDALSSKVSVLGRFKLTGWLNLDAVVFDQNSCISQIGCERNQ